MAAMAVACTVDARKPIAPKRVVLTVLCTLTRIRLTPFGGRVEHETVDEPQAGKSATTESAEVAPKPFTFA